MSLDLLSTGWIMDIETNRLLTDYCRAILAAGQYHDTAEEGKFYAVVLEQTHTQQGGSSSQGTPGS